MKGHYLLALGKFKNSNQKKTLKFHLELNFNNFMKEKMEKF